MEKKIEKLIKEIEKDITKNVDLIELTGRSVVGCVLISKNGKIYKGMNVAWWHSTCAEMVALGNGLMDGERDFEYLITVKFNKRNSKFELMSPCGMCREMFKEFDLQDLQVVLRNKKGQLKFEKISKLLPQ